jgi:hypothetical protein
MGSRNWDVSFWNTVSFWNINCFILKHFMYMEMERRRGTKVKPEGKTKLNSPSSENTPFKINDLQLNFNLITLHLRRHYFPPVNK